MRRDARVDANQARIVEVLRQVGATVQHLHTVGTGCPDILVGWQDNNYLMEIKDGRKPPSKRRLTDDEIKWHDTWGGQVAIVHNETEALSVLGLY